MTGNKDHTTVPYKMFYGEDVKKSNGVWQLCPKCLGEGNLVSFTHDLSFSSTALPLCDVCNGKKIISSITGLPPI